MKHVIPLLLLILLGSGCVPAGQSDMTGRESAAKPVVTRHVAFAADFANGLGCTGATNSVGCDLYSAEVTSEGDVQNVTRLTDAAAAETFPAWHPTDDIVYFNNQPKESGSYEMPDVDYLVLDTGETGRLIRHASHPTVTPTGDAVIYSTVPRHVLTLGNLSAARTEITATETLVAGEDRFEPMVSGDGNLVVFHETSETNAGASIYNATTKQITNISAVDGTGHCAINAAGTLAVCDQKTGGGLAGTPIVSGEIGASALAVPDPSIAAIRALDQDYADCDLASVNFPSFFDDETLLVTVSCHQRGPDGIESPIFSKLFLVHLETTAFLPIGKRLAEAFGGVGRDSYTAAAR